MFACVRKKERERDEAILLSAKNHRICVVVFISDDDELENQATNVNLSTKKIASKYGFAVQETFPYSLKGVNDFVTTPKALSLTSY